MRQPYVPNRDGKVAMWRDMRSRARVVGDLGIEQMTNLELSRLGALETTQAVVEMERAVPEKPRRGRKPLPRCEHNQIASRCLECADDAA